MKCPLSSSIISQKHHNDNESSAWNESLTQKSFSDNINPKIFHGNENDENICGGYYSMNVYETGVYHGKNLIL